MQEYGEFWPDQSGFDENVNTVSDEAWRHLESRGGQLVINVRKQINDDLSRLRVARQIGEGASTQQIINSIEQLFSMVEYLVSHGSRHK